eukprot:TRINITY_DN825_c1_g2_i1.p1 TRINITY_DN825_c1_g2~~TRINITY_DN825_c1_g2_i1.p1  ORF type:complete len:517 (+),score=22.46 TRINITY_DN825_c1_g2_i1:70-1551(+)
MRSFSLTDDEIRLRAYMSKSQHNSNHESEIETQIQQPQTHVSILDQSIRTPLILDSRSQKLKEAQKIQRFNVTLCCFTLLLLIGPILLIGGLVILGLEYRNYEYGVRKQLSLAVQRWNDISYRRFKTSSFEVELYIGNYYQCPPDLQGPILPRIRYEMYGSKFPLDPEPTSIHIDTYQQWKYRVAIPGSIVNLTQQYNNDCSLVIYIFNNETYGGDYPIGRISGQINRTQRLSLQDICDLDIDSVNMTSGQQQACEKQCQQQYAGGGGVTDWEQGLCIQAQQLQQMCTRVDELGTEKNFWQETGTLRRYQEVGHGCFMKENDRSFQNTLYGEEESLNEQEIVITLRSNDDPFIYFEYLTQGTFNLGMELVVEDLVYAGIIIFMVGAMLTTAWFMVCVCCFRACCKKDQRSFLSDPVGRLLYKAAKKYNSFIEMKKMQVQSYKGIPPKAEPGTSHRSIEKPDLPQDQQVIHQMLIEESFSFGKPHTVIQPPIDD